MVPLLRRLCLCCHVQSLTRVFYSLPSADVSVFVAESYSPNILSTDAAVVVINSLGPQLHRHCRRRRYLRRVVISSPLANASVIVVIVLRLIYLHQRLYHF